MLRTSTRADLPALQALWQCCFGDAPQAVALYFTHAWRPERVFVCQEDGAPVAMAAWFFCLVRQRPAAYLYAVCTHPDYRGRGICRDLLAFARSYLAARNIRQLLLVPGEPPLFSFYQALGYRTVGAIGVVSVHSGADLPIRAIGPEEYYLRRERALRQVHAAYPPPALRYQQTLSRYSGGDLFAIGRTGCAAVECTPNGPLCKEVLGCTPELGAGAILRVFGGEQCVARFPDAGGRPFCMGLGVAPGCYLGLAFD